jgi:serine/threonine protein kinase
METDQNWKQREGQLVAGKFRLVQYIGGSDHAGVFLTERGPAEKAALKLIPADQINADAQLARCKVAASLSHPHLLRVFEFGKSQLENKPYVYVVSEFADENLSQVVPQRALNPEEALPVLTAVADVLEYLHARRLLHGRIKPANIMAVGEQLKISSDSICEISNCARSDKRDAYTAPEYGPGMTSAVDIWSLGMTLVGVLTQKLPPVDAASDPAIPPALPQPFFDVVRRSLRRDPKQRWTAEEIRKRLNSSSAMVPPSPQTKAAEPEAQPMRSRPRYLVPVLALAGLVVLLFILAFHHRPASQVAAPTPPNSSAEGNPSETPSPKPSPLIGETRPAPPPSGNSSPGTGRVLSRVMPAVAPSAMRTISGHFRIAVRAKVDSSGSVSDAAFVIRGPSQYFARLSMDAAKKWKFTPPVVDGKPAPSEWLIKFQFSRTGINDSAEQRSP